MLIYALCCIPLVSILIGIPLLIVLCLGSLVLAIIATIRVSYGLCYRYPLTLGSCPEGRFTMVRRRDSPTSRRQLERLVDAGHRHLHLPRITRMPVAHAFSLSTSAGCLQLQTTLPSGRGG